MCLTNVGPTLTIHLLLNTSIALANVRYVFNKFQSLQVFDT